MFATSASFAGHSDLNIYTKKRQKIWYANGLGCCYVQYGLGNIVIGNFFWFVKPLQYIFLILDHFPIVNVRIRDFQYILFWMEINNLVLRFGPFGMF